MHRVSSRLEQVQLFANALPIKTYERLYAAVVAIGDEKPDGKDTYAKTFWFCSGSTPTNIVEEALIELEKCTQLSEEYVGMEWWIGRLKHGKKLSFHFDRDLSLSRSTGKSVYPELSSVFYLNHYYSSPTVLLDQVPSEDGKSKSPDKVKLSTSVMAIPNHYVIFPGNLRHGVIPDSSKLDQDSPSEYRLTLLVNYWNRRPSAPICCDYDGSVYASLSE